MASTKAAFFQREQDSKSVRVANEKMNNLFPVACAATCLLFMGCSDVPYQLAPVRGTVTIDGKPLVGGKVMFAPITREGGHEAGKAAVGILQSDGSYMLTTYRKGDGAIVGEHWVTIFPPADEAAVVKLPKFRRFTVRQKQPVAADQDNVIELALNSEEIARYAAK